MLATALFQSSSPSTTILAARSTQPMPRRRFLVPQRRAHSQTPTCTVLEAQVGRLRLQRLARFLFAAASPISGGPGGFRPPGHASCHSHDHGRLGMFFADAAPLTFFRIHRDLTVERAHLPTPELVPMLIRLGGGRFSDLRVSFGAGGAFDFWRRPTPFLFAQSASYVGFVSGGDAN